MVTPDDSFAFTITGRDIWDKLDSIEKQTSGLPVKVEDHETRIRVLEKKVWVASGFAAAFGGGLGATLSQLFGG